MSDQQAITPPESEKPPIAQKTAIIPMSERGISLQSFEDAFRFSRAVIASGLAPKAFTSPEAVMVAIQFGAELGLPPMSALQNIAVINGRPTVWGDAVLGVCSASGNLEDYKDEVVGADESYGYRVTVKRKGRSEPVVRTFTVAMAKKAGLWAKPGPWSQYPDRMLLMRARTFALRDTFPDAMRGLVTYEEARDHPEEPKNVTRSLDEIDAPKP